MATRSARAVSVRELAERVRPVALARNRRLPVLEALEALLPEGLPRGNAVAVTAAPCVAGATSLTLALAARAAQEGSWVAVVGLPALGLAAAHRLGIPLERIVVVTRVGREAAAVIAALADGFDVLMVDPYLHLALRDSRRLVARLRERGSVMLIAGGDLPGGGTTLILKVVSSTWEGLDSVGHLNGCRVVIEATGRGADSRVRRAELWLPGPDASVTATDAQSHPTEMQEVG